MTQSVPLLPSADTPQDFHTMLGAEFRKNVLPIVIGVGALVIAASDWARKAEQAARVGHAKRERLAAYRVRHKWKRSDVKPLLSIGMSDIALRRIDRLEGRGRPVVRKHRPFDETVLVAMKTLLAIFDEKTDPDTRQRLFRHWPWWKHHVEAMYRGELALAQANSVRAPHEHAECVVADALIVSPSTVHATCNKVRAMRREDAESANFPPMLVSDHARWMRTGRYRNPSDRVIDTVATNDQ